MDQIKTYKKKDSFVKLENKKNFAINSLNKTIITALNNENIINSLNNDEKDIIKSLKKDFLNNSQKMIQRFLRLKKIQLQK